MSFQVDALEPRRVLATFTVSNLADSGGGSLRDAIEAANALEGADVIEFEPSLAAGTITLGGTELTISDDLTINGLGADLLTVSGNNESRVFYNESDVTTTISGLTITGGNANGWDDGHGGGVRNNGLLTLIQVVVSGNSTGEFLGSGGGIGSFFSSVLTLVDSTVSGNVATAEGGGICVEGPLTVVNSMITGNTASFYGGGIASWEGAVTLTNSVVSHNTAGRSGGGIENFFGTLTLHDSTVSDNVVHDTLFGFGDGGGISNGGPLTLNNSTVSGNIAGHGGGITSHGGPATLNNSTISGNIATEGAGGGIQSGASQLSLNNSTVTNNSAAIGGGLYLLVIDAEPTVAISCLIAGNTASGHHPDFYGQPLASGSINNLIGDAGSAGGLVNGVDGNIVGVDPLLGPLVDNGGPTETHALLSDSPAIDQGINPHALATDQRGAGREQGDGADIGAFEWGTTSAPRGGSDGDNTHRVVSIDAFGHVLAFEQGWTFENLQEKTGAPNAIGTAIIWTDPKDGLTYVAAASLDGLLLFTRSDSGDWSFRNLTTETAASASPIRDLTHFISIRRKIVVIAGITADGDVVAFQQTLAAAPEGGPAFEFVNISADLESQGQTTPDLTGLTSYVPSWDTWHLAGVDTDGKIQSIWINTNNPNFTKWRANDLSAITGAPAIAGQLAVTLTSWGGINLTGLDQAGNLLTTWWIPRFGGQWAVSNLTAAHDGPPLVGGNLTAYTTPWGGINYVGLDAGGVTRVYWWVPAFGGRWAANRLLPTATPETALPVGALHSSSSASGTLNVYGLSADGDILRMSWQPGASSAWTVEDLTEIAEER